jgi:hypothetical protein
MTRARDVANIDGILTAKGDIYAATGVATPARLGVGANGETLVANSSTSTGLNYTATSGQNFCINGSMDFWQRGTSVSGAGINYGADRWQVYRSAAVTGGTFSRQDGTGAGFTYAYRMQRDSGSTLVNSLFLTTNFETSISRNLQGQFLTLSFWARKGANYSPTVGSAARILGGTGTDQTISNGYTGQTDLANLDINSPNITTSWARYSVTTSAAIANTITQIGLSFSFTPTGTAGAEDFIEISGVKLEIGKAATAFTRAGETIQGELSAAQRYYWRSTANDVFTFFNMGVATTTARTDHFFQFPVRMRVKPTAIESANLLVSDGAGGNFTATALILNQGNTDGFGVYQTGSTGMTQFRPLFLEANNTTAAYVAFSAEL